MIECFYCLFPLVRGKTSFPISLPSKTTSLGLLRIASHALMSKTPMDLQAIFHLRVHWEHCFCTRAKPMIHLGTYLESQEIPVWNAKALPLLNESFFQKGCNGYFTVNACTFLEEYFVSPPNPISQNLHPQMGHVQVKALDDLFGPQVACVEGKEHIEILDDVFGP